MIVKITEKMLVDGYQCTYDSGCNVSTVAVREIFWKYITLDGAVCFDWHTADGIELLGPRAGVVQLDAGRLPNDELVTKMFEIGAVRGTYMRI